MLELREVEVAYGNIRALKGISLTVAEGELVTLIGSNGAGKSTTLKTISGLLRPRSGTLSYRGQQLDRLPPHKIVALGISHCPEGRHLFGRLTVTENLRLGAVQRRNREGVNGDIEHIFKLFPLLKERSAQLAGTLSGGEQQMLAIARALIGGPRLLLLDEPTEGLAPVIVEELIRIVQEVRRAGVSVLLVEQNLKFCEALADRYCILDQGSIVFTADRAGFAGAYAERERYLAVAAY
jgi:branched-chain amino acid transport system ATP-binding protein